jgi:hypothetical protein
MPGSGGGLRAEDRHHRLVGLLGVLDADLGQALVQGSQLALITKHRAVKRRDQVTGIGQTGPLAARRGDKEVRDGPRKRTESR